MTNCRLKMNYRTIREAVRSYTRDVDICLLSISSFYQYRILIPVYARWFTKVFQQFPYEILYYILQDTAIVNILEKLEIYLRMFKYLVIFIFVKDCLQGFEYFREPMYVYGNRHRELYDSSD